MRSWPLVPIMGIVFLCGLTGCGERKTPQPASVPSPRPVTLAPKPKPPAGVALPASTLALASYKPTPDEFIQAKDLPNRVALTFDAGSDASAVSLMLKTLKERNLRATFFLTGKFAEQFPEASRAIADAGMEIGNHSYSHPRFTALSDDRVQEQLERAEVAILKACGRGAKPLFRFPYGDRDERTTALVAGAGYQSIYWTLDSHDSLGKPKSADFYADRIIKKIKPGYVTLMHVSSVNSAKALPRILDYLKKNKMTTVPVSELLLHSPPGTGSVRTAFKKNPPIATSSGTIPGTALVGSDRVRLSSR